MSLYIEENRDVPLKEIPLRCKARGGILRRGVIWFDDNISLSVIDTRLMFIEYSNVIFIVGTSGLVETAASMVS